jgi:hypothetical protein
MLFTIKQHNCKHALVGRAGPLLLVQAIRPAGAEPREDITIGV